MSDLSAPEAPPTAADDLQEDILGTWSPDVAGWVDLAHYGDDAPQASYVAQSLLVPRPKGTPSDARILHPAWHVALHQATLPLRNIADQVLSPGVFGYRLGASAGQRYIDNWQLFCQFVKEQTEEYPYMVISDIRAFFPSTPWPKVLDAVRPLLGSQDLTRLEEVIAPLEAGGLSCLPTGYGDARLLANIVLSQVDSRLKVPFARWVDDYRLFARDLVQAQAALDSLDEALSSVGLTLNREKTRIQRSDEASEQHYQALGSAYQPETDSEDEIAEKLHKVFSEASANPITQRRQLRFVLRRLAKQEDDIAIPFVLENLTKLPWEAPRMVGYLAALAETHDLSAQANHLALQAARDGNPWMLCRLAPLMTQVELSDETAKALEGAHPSLPGTPAWGLTLRALALSGYPQMTLDALRERSGDARAIITSARDLDILLPEWLREAEPVLASVLADETAPPLVSESLL